MKAARPEKSVRQQTKLRAPMSIPRPHTSLRQRAVRIALPFGFCSADLFPACTLSTTACTIPAHHQKPDSRTVAGIGLPEKWAMMSALCAVLYRRGGFVARIVPGSQKRRPKCVFMRHKAWRFISQYWWSKPCLVWLEQLLIQHRWQAIRAGCHHIPGHFDDSRLERRTTPHRASARAGPMV